jgi:hypothetical protein
MLSLAKFKVLTNGNTSTHPGLGCAPPIAAFLFLSDVKIAMPTLVLFIISMVVPIRSFLVNCYVLLLFV